MENLHPYELHQLYTSFLKIENLLNYLDEKKLNILHDNSFSVLLKGLYDFKDYIENVRKV
jgi:hypothetical protein